MDEQHPSPPEPSVASRAEDEVSDAELDAVAGGLARIWMGDATLVAERADREPADARG